MLQVKPLLNPGQNHSDEVRDSCSRVLRSKMGNHNPREVGSAKGTAKMTQTGKANRELSKNHCVRFRGGLGSSFPDLMRVNLSCDAQAAVAHLPGDVWQVFALVDFE